MLEFHNVSKIYCGDIDKERRAALRAIFWKPIKSSHLKPGRILALEDISFSVQKGRPFLILGASGSGKTTIARLACGLSQPNSGKVRIGGGATLVSHKGISATPFITLKHHIYLHAMSYGADSKDLPALYDRILRMDGFKDFTDQNVKRMPNSLVKRLNFYLGLFVDTDIYVFDETFAYDTFVREPMFKDRFDEIIESRTVLVLTKNITGGLESVIKDAMVLDGGRGKGCTGFEDAIKSYNNLMEDVKLDLDSNSSNGSVESEFVNITSVRLTDADGYRIKPCVDTKSRACIPSTKDLYVNIICNISKTGISVSGAVDVYSRNTYVFGGRQPFFSVNLAGEYRLCMMIPSNLLANNVYSLNVSVIAYDGSQKHKAKLHNALEFRVASPIEQTASSQRQVLSGVLISPRLEWDFTVDNPIGE